MTPSDKPIIEAKLLARRLIDDNTGCWLWTGGKSNGYGDLKYKGRSYRVPRLSAWLTHGLDLEDAQSFACHKCDIPACYNPDHLFIGDCASNKRDSVQKGRARGPRGEKSGSAKLNSDKVRQIYQLRHAGHTLMSLAKRFNVSDTTIYSIATRKKWKHLWS